MLEAACSCPDVERFIFISSDKAESPSQSYGRTKRINELLVQSFASEHPKIRFGSMRYCNVLDAAGSFAIPTFRDQIMNGRPITVRRMSNGEIPTRYFMPLHLAAKLAIKAGFEAGNGEIFSLDKVRIEPIRIDELVKVLARRFGISDVDSWFDDNVTFVQHERGEKKAEELGKGESLPDAPLIRIPVEEFPNSLLLNEVIDKLLSLSDNVDADEVIESFLKEIVDNSGLLFMAGGRVAEVADHERPRPPSGVELGIVRELLLTRMRSIPRLANPRELAYIPLARTGKKTTVELTLDIPNLQWIFAKKNHSEIDKLVSRIGAEIYQEGRPVVCKSEKIECLSFDSSERSLRLKIAFTPQIKGDYKGIRFIVDGNPVDDFDISPFEIVVIGAEEKGPEEIEERPIRHTATEMGENMIILSGLSGVGKKTVYETLKDHYGPGLERIIVPTADQGESVKHESRDVLSHAAQNDIDRVLSEGKFCLLETGCKTALDIKAKYPRAITVFMLPLSEEEIRKKMQDGHKSRLEVIQDEMRSVLENRAEPADSLISKLKRVEENLSHADNFDMIVGNSRWHLSATRDAFIRLIESKKIVGKAIGMI